jgi:xanthine dehydrogenase small subunit
MTVFRPRSPREAASLYAEHPEAVPLAGGTDFMVGWNAGLANGHRILDLSALASWHRIRETDRGLRLGALVTHWQLQGHPLVAKRLPLLVEACSTIGGRQIQTRGTLGGNIANASPAADTFPPLAVYEARLRLVSATGRRTIPFLEVFSGVKKTTLAPGELIESIEVDFPKRATRQFFRKVGTRAASAISKTVAAGIVRLGSDGRIREFRFALGSVAPTVRRLHGVEMYVLGNKPTARLADEASRLVEKDIAPIDDLRSTRAYRLEVSRNLVRFFLLG